MTEPAPGLVIPSVGFRFRLYGALFEVAAVDERHVRYVAAHGGRIARVTRQRFAELAGNPHFEVDFRVPPPDRGIRLFSPATLRPAEAGEINRRRRYVEAIVRLDARSRARPLVETLIARIAAEAGKAPAPGVSTVYRWLRTYLASGRNPLSLAPHIRWRGNRQPRLSEGTAAIMAERLESDYLNDHRISAVRLHSHIVGHLLEAWGGQQEASARQPEMPSLRTVQRRIEALDPYVRDRARQGKHEAARRHKASGSSREVSRILEVVEADGTVLDVLAVDPGTGEVFGRPYCAALIDVYSRVVPAFLVSFTPFCAATVLRVLKAACADGPPEACRGRMELLVVDNGPDYIGDALRNFAQRAAISIEPSPPGTPDAKPHIEAFLKTLNHELIHALKGTTFANPGMRGDYPSARLACLDLETLRQRIQAWLDGDYHRRVHAGTRRAPLALWRESAARHPPIAWPSGELDVIARTMARCPPQGGRVRHDNLFWYSHALATLEQSPGWPGGGGGKVDVYIDEFDLGRVFIEDPRHRGRFIVAESTRPGYAQGLSLYEHRRIMADLRRQSQADLAALPTHALEIARWRFWQDTIRDGEAFGRKQVARLTGGQGRPTPPTAPALPEAAPGVAADDAAGPGPEAVPGDAPAADGPQPGPAGHFGIRRF